MRSIVVGACFAALSICEARAQTPPVRRGEIVGHVANAATKTPLSNATVEITLAGAATPASRVITNDAGAFRAVGLALGRYTVSTRVLAFRPLEVRAVDLLSSAPRADVGVVALTPAPQELQAVEVIIHREDVQLAPDRNTFTVRDMPT